MSTGEGQNESDQKNIGLVQAVSAVHAEIVEVIQIQQIIGQPEITKDTVANILVVVAVVGCVGWNINHQFIWLGVFFDSIHSFGVAGRTASSSREDFLF